MHVIADKGHFQITRISGEQERGKFEIHAMKEGASGNGWYPYRLWATIEMGDKMCSFPWTASIPGEEEEFPDFFAACLWAMDEF